MTKITVDKLKSVDNDGKPVNEDKKLSTDTSLPESPDTNIIKKVDETPVTVDTKNENGVASTSGVKEPSQHDATTTPDVIKVKKHKRHKRKSILNVPKVYKPSVQQVDKKPLGFKIGIVLGVVLGGLGLYFLIMKLRAKYISAQPSPAPVKVDNSTELPDELNLSQ